MGFWQLMNLEGREKIKSLLVGLKNAWLTWDANAFIAPAGLFMTILREIGKRRVASTRRASGFLSVLLGGKAKTIL